MNFSRAVFMKWHKKLQNFLSGGEKPAEIYSGASAEMSVLPLLKLLGGVSETVVVTFPDAPAVDRAAEAFAALQELAGTDFTLLTVPECGRGKLLFPGGEARRARALNRILNEKNALVFGSVHSLLGPAPEPQESADSQLELRPGMVIRQSDLLERVVKLDYDDEVMVTVSGEFSRRGGIVDIFSPAHDEPCRIEFFDNEIESIRF